MSSVLRDRFRPVEASRARPLRSPAMLLSAAVSLVFGCANDSGDPTTDGAVEGDAAGEASNMSDDGTEGVGEAEGEGDEDGDGDDEDGGDEDGDDEGDHDTSVEEGADTENDCSIPAYVDDLSLDEAAAAELPGEPRRTVAVGEQIWISGQGFVGTARGDGGAIELASGLDAAMADYRALADVGDGRVVAGSQDGALLLFKLGTDGAPQLAGELRTEGLRYSELLGVEGRLFAAVGSGGVQEYEIVDEAPVLVGEVPGSKDARGLAWTDAGLVVADGFVPGVQGGDSGGAEIRLLDPDGGGVIDEIVGLDGIAHRVVAHGQRVAVLRFGGGFEIFDVSGGGLELETSQVANGALGLPLDLVWLTEDEVLVVGASVLQRFELSKDRPTLISTEERSVEHQGGIEAPWFRAAARLGDRLWIARDDALVPLELGDGQPAPKLFINASTHTLTVDEEYRYLRYENLGNADLIVQGATAAEPFALVVDPEDNSEREGCPGQFVVGPNRGLLARLSRTDDGQGPIVGQVTLLSNDPDRPEYPSRAESGRPLPMPGDDTENFVLPDFDGGSFNADASRGEILFVKLFAPG